MLANVTYLTGYHGILFSNFYLNGFLERFQQLCHKLLHHSSNCTIKKGALGGGEQGEFCFEA